MSYLQCNKEWLEINKNYPKRPVTVSDVVDHIDHVVKVAGIDYVGIGTGFDGGGGVNGCFDVCEMRNITFELIKRGYSESGIEKIWGGNFLRVFKTVKRVANEIQSRGDKEEISQYIYKKFIHSLIWNATYCHLKI